MSLSIETLKSFDSPPVGKVYGSQSPHPLARGLAPHHHRVPAHQAAKVGNDGPNTVDGCLDNVGDSRFQKNLLKANASDLQMVRRQIDIDANWPQTDYMLAHHI
jgi:hypothetical protein